MKQVISIIRPHTYFTLKNNLEKNGFNAMSVYDVTGRGKQEAKMVAYTAGNGTDEYIEHHPMIAKKMISIFVRDKDCSRLTKVIQECACTHSPGDGKIFILSVDNGIRIRTGEENDESIV